MTDVHTKELRSYNMSQIKGKDSKPEILVRRFLFSNGFRYRIHNKNLPGKPDIVLTKHKSVVFIHGCFWHGHDCRNTRPEDNKDYWQKKRERNIRHDEEISALFISRGVQF